MFTAKRRGFIALLAALLLAALIAFGISMLPAASRTASAETKTVFDAGTLLNAFIEANEGDTIRLESNIELDMTDPTKVNVPGGHMVIASEDALLELYKDEGMTAEKAKQDAVANNITLDLNQNTLTLKTTSDFGCIAVYGVNLTVKNGTINGESKAGLAVVGNARGDNGALTVEDTTINFKNLDTQAQSAAPVISGEGELTLSNVTYKLSAAEGAQAPVAPYVAEIGGKGYSSLQDAFDNATSGQTVVLSANITVDKYITVNYDDERKIGSGKDNNLNITFDLNGHVITLAESFTTQFSMDGRSSNKLAGGAFLRIYGAGFTIIDNNATAKSSAWENVGGGIDGRKITAIDEKEVSDNDGNEVTLIVAQDGAKVTISAGTYVIKDNTAACVYAFGESTVNLVDGGTEDIAASYITIEGGEFINLSNAEYGYGTGSALVVNQANVAEQLVAIQGGTFYGRNPALGDDSKAAGTFITSGVKLYEDLNGNYIATEGDVPEGAVNTFYFEDGQVVSELNSAKAIKTAIEDGADYIRLGDNITGSIEIPADKEITLDLNGKTLTNTEGEHTITNYGTLTVTGTGTVDNISHGRGALINYGTATLSGGKFTRSQENGTFGDGVSASEGGTYSANGNSWYTLKNYGALTINKDVTVTTRIDAEVEGNPVGGYSSLIANGYQNSDDRTNNYDKVTTDNKIPQLTIAGGTFSGGINSIKNDEYSGLEISGGTFTNTTQHTVLNYGKAEVSGGEFVVSGSGKAAIWTEYYNTTTPGTLTVSGGEFTSDTYALVAMNGADVNITDGIFSAEYAVLANGNTTAVDIEDGDFDGKIFSQSPEFTNISGGTFSEKPDSNYLAENMTAYSVGDKFVVGNTEDEGTLEDIVAAGAVAMIEGDSTVYYTSLADAVKAAADGATITLIADTLEQKQVNITKNLTIDLNGFDIVRDGTSGSAIGIKGGYTLTLKGEGMIAAAGSSLPITRYLFGNTPYHVVSDAGIIYSRPITEDWFAKDSYTLSYDSATGGFKVVEGATVATITVGANVYAFDSLKSAFSGAQDGETIVLMQDITIDDNSRVAYGESAILDKAVTLDLNGYTINSECSSYPVISIVTSNDFTITSTRGTGKIVLGGGRALRIEVAAKSDITISISNIVITGNTNALETVYLNGSAEGSSLNAVIDGVKLNINVASGSNTVFGIRVTDANLVMRDSTVEIGRGAGFTADTVALQGSGSDITIVNSVFNSKNGAGVTFFGSCTEEQATNTGSVRYNSLTLRDVFVYGYTFGLSGNASEGNHGTIFNIENSTIAGTIGAGIFHPQVGILNILGNGNVISGTSGIEMRGGSLNIEGGVFTATSAELDISANPGSGSTIDGAAIVVSQHGYNPAIQVSIAGGVFNGLYALYEEDLVNEEGTEDIQISVSGGMYNGGVLSENVTAFVNGGKFAAALDASYIAEGVVYYSVAGGYAVVGESEFDPADTTGVAIAGGIVYDDLQAAVDAAEEGATVTLLKDIEDGYVIIRKSIDIDLNGYSITSLSDSGSALVTVLAVGSVKDNSDRITVNIYSSKEGGEIVSDNQNINSRAVYAYGAVDITIENVAIINTYTGSDDKVDDGAYGFVIGSSADTMTTNAVVRNVTIFGSYPAVYVNGSGVAERPSSFIAYDSKIYSDYVGIMGYGVESRVENGILNTWWQTYIELNNTDLIVDSGNASEDISAVYKGIGIYHPMQGTLVINGGSVTGVATAVEMRIGTLIVKGGAKLESTSVLFKCTAEGSGWTTAGAAVAVSQHSTQMPINVVIEDGTLEGKYALYEKDTIENGTPSDGVELSILDGTFSAVYSQNITGFISGGEFAQALDGEYIAPGYAFDEATGTVVSATLNNNALADVRAYLAAYGLLYGDIEDLAAAETPDALAQAIVNAYEAIAAATGEEAIAVAKMDALDAIDAFIDNLNTVKAEAIDDLKLYAFSGDGTSTENIIIVAVPTYVVSAINQAISENEVEQYVSYAKAEMDDIRAERLQADSDFEALQERFDALYLVLGMAPDDLIPTSSVITEITDTLEAIDKLLGTTADTASNDTIYGKLEEATGKIDNVYTYLTENIADMLTGTGGISSQLEELKDLVDADSELATDIDNILLIAGRIEQALGDISSENTLSKVLADLDTLIDGYKDAVEQTITDYEGKFEELKTEIISAIPTDEEIAAALESKLTELIADIAVIKAQIVAEDGADSALVTAINEKIEAAFESFGNTFTSELGSINTAISKLGTAVDALDSLIGTPDGGNTLVDLINAATQAAEAAGAKVDALTGESGALTTIDEKIGAIDSVVDGIADAQESMGNALATFATATDTALKGIQSDIDGLESKLNAMANTAATDKADILAKIAELKSAADDISEAIASLDGDSAEDLSGIAEDLAALQTALDGVKADIGNVSQQVGGVAEDNTNSMSNFAGLYLFLSALVVLAIAILIVVSVKKRR